MAATTFQVGSFDVANFSDEELWAKANSLARFYAALGCDFRLLAYSRPYPLDAPLDAIKRMMADAPDPRRREQIAAYRRFVEQIVLSAYLKTTAYYLTLFSNRPSHLLAGVVAAGLRLPVQQVPHLPPLARGRYRAGVNCLSPAQPGRPGSPRPHVALLYSYDFRGQISFDTTIAFLQLACPLCLAVDVKTVHPNKAIRTLQFAYNKLRADLIGQTGNEAPDPEKQQAFFDVQEAMQQVNNQRLGLHRVGLCIAILADRRDKLEEYVELVTATALRHQIALRPAWMHQQAALAFFTAGPVPDLITGEYRNFLSTGLPYLTPYGFEVRRAIHGPFIAINRDTGSPFWLDKFSLPAYNEIVLGRTGSGKTFATGLRAYREAMFEVQTVFVDPQSNFRRVTEVVGGKYNFLRLGAGTALNVLDVVHDNAAAQVSHVVVMLQSILGRPLAIAEKSAVDHALIDLYRRHLRSDEFRAEEMPRLEDLAHALGPSAPGLVQDLERFVGGSLAEVFNSHTTLSLDLDRRYPIVTFDLSDLEGEFQPTFIFALLSSIERVIRHRRGQQLPTNVVIDEFGILSEIPALAQAAGMLAKRVRAWKVGIQCLDQNWATFETAAGRRILENALVKVVMRVDDTAAPAIVKNLGLTGHHAEVILTADVGEGILIVENKPYHVHFTASPAEVQMLTPYARQAGQAMPLPTRRKANV